MFAAIKSQGTVIAFAWAANFKSNSISSDICSKIGVTVVSATWLVASPLIKKFNISAILTPILPNRAVSHAVSQILSTSASVSGQVRECPRQVGNLRPAGVHALLEPLSQRSTSRQTQDDVFPSDSFCWGH